MLFPLMDRHGYLYRLRLRLDRPDTDENGKEKTSTRIFPRTFQPKKMIVPSMVFSMVAEPEVKLGFITIQSMTILFSVS